jgi:hypothetical protein
MMNQRVADVAVTDTLLIITLSDGDVLSRPLSWYPRLQRASLSDRLVWEPSAAGHGIHWPHIDEHLSVEGLLRGEWAVGA